jgi:hypothetical protein
MAVRIDRDAIVKYADKAILAVALAFLIFTAVKVLVLGRTPASVKRSTVDDAYRAAVEKQSRLFSNPRERDADIRTVLGVPSPLQELFEALLKKSGKNVDDAVREELEPFTALRNWGENDKAGFVEQALALAREMSRRSLLAAFDEAEVRKQADEAFARWIDWRNKHADDLTTYMLLRLPYPEYARIFKEAHQTQALPVWADQARWDPYKAAAVYAAPPPERLSIPKKRVAPYLLQVIQGKGYKPSGKEKDRQFGADILYVSGQARVDLQQQTLWSQKDALGLTINQTLLTGYQVERAQLNADGTWGPWQARPTVRYETVKGQPLFKMVKEGDPKKLDADVKERKLYIDAVIRLKTDFVKNQEQILHPLFFELAGKDWIPPYETLGVQAEAERPAESSAPSETPDEGGVSPTGEVAPASEIAPSSNPSRTAGPKARQTADLWFTDELSVKDVGKTYQYRVRVLFFNPIFGADLAASNPNERYVIEVPGEWSEASAAITLAPIVRFYFVGRFGDKANIELHRWIYGRWHRTKGAFDVGDPISIERSEDIKIPGKQGDITLPNREKVQYDAGATVVDIMSSAIRFSGSINQTDKLVYLKHLTNTLAARLVFLDKNALGRDIKAEAAEEVAVERRRPEAPGVNPGVRGEIPPPHGPTFVPPGSVTRPPPAGPRPSEIRPSK